MKEHPILFSTPMVRAIIDGRKRQTRRVIKWRMLESLRCPYGKPGNKLWVRETWRVGAWKIRTSEIAVDYESSGPRKEWLFVENTELFNRLVQQSIDDSANTYGRQETYLWKPGDSPCRWRPSIFMPKWAAQLWLEILDIRVERLQYITENDARMEGCYRQGLSTAFPQSQTYKDDFKQLWNSINGKKYSWESNPWIWRVEFKVLAHTSNGGTATGQAEP